MTQVKISVTLDFDMSPEEFLDLLMDSYDGNVANMTHKADVYTTSIVSIIDQPMED